MQLVGCVKLPPKAVFIEVSSFARLCNIAEHLINCGLPLGHGIKLV
jgi:hypothetical protein